jgi:hypothetical protein
LGAICNGLGSSKKCAMHVCTSRYGNRRQTGSSVLQTKLSL